MGELICKNCVNTGIGLFNKICSCKYGIAKHQVSETNWKEEIKKINQCSQRQDSTSEQMIDLCVVANKLGFYDAADFIRSTFGNKIKG